MYPTLVSRRSALSTLLMPSASHSCARLIPGCPRTNASTLCATVGRKRNVYSRASAPSNGTRRGLYAGAQHWPPPSSSLPRRWLLAQLAASVRCDGAASGRGRMAGI